MEYYFMSVSSILSIVISIAISSTIFFYLYEKEKHRIQELEQGKEPTGSNPLVEIVIVLFTSLLDIFLSLLRKEALKRTKQTQKSLLWMINRPWSSIDHIVLRQSELGNRILAVYFQDDAPPKGLNISHFDREKLINDLKDIAAEEGFTFAVEDSYN